MRRSLQLSCALLVSVATVRANAQVVDIDYATTLARARAVSPDVASVRAREAIARADIGIAGTYPNPTFTLATSTQYALFSASVSVPLVVFGQIGAGRDAARAELATARVDTQVAWTDARAQAAHAFVALWLAQRVADERKAAATIQSTLDQAVRGRVEVGSAPEIDALRTHAEELRADAESRATAQLVDAAASALGRWIGDDENGAWRATGDPFVPAAPPSLVSLRARAVDAPAVRRERADERAALARASHERSLVAPTMALELGTDIGDPTIPGPDFRAQLTFDLPIFNHRGSYVERENSAAAAARARADAERARATSELGVAYARFEAARTRLNALESSVVPAAEAAAKAIEEAYLLGRAPLVTVLDAERARIDAHLALQQARAERADAWIDVEHAAGTAP
jgi:cobalt-zinc-cadmium efflux system outer membrane protein